MEKMKTAWVSPVLSANRPRQGGSLESRRRISRNRQEALQRFLHLPGAKSRKMKREERLDTFA